MPNQKQPVLSQQDDDEIDLLAIIHTIIQGKWLILLFILLVSVIAFIIAYGQEPIYKADTLLRVEAQKATIPSLSELTGLSNIDTSISTELELIKSRKSLSQAVTNLKLDIVASPKKMPYLGNLYKCFFNNTKKGSPIVGVNNSLDAWGDEYIAVDRLDVPKKWLNKPFILVAMKNNSFYIKIGDDILLNGKVGLSATSKNNKLSIFVSKLGGEPGTEFNLTKLSMRRAISKLKKSIIASEKGKKTSMINLSLTGSNQDTIVNILNNISSNYVEQNITRSSEEASNALLFLEEQIKPVKEDVDKTEASLNKYRTENKTADLLQETQAILDVAVKIDAKLHKISLSRVELSQRFSKQHPTIQALNAQENNLRQQKKRTLGKIEKLPQKQQELLKLKRNVKVANTIYIDLLNRIQEFKIAKASTVGNAYIVDVADIDDSYIKPNRKLILALGALLGAMLGVIMIFLRKALHIKVVNPEKLEETTGLPVYATVPLSKNVSLTKGFGGKDRKQKSLLAAENTTDLTIESLRSLRTSLHFALHEAKNNIVMITGPSPNIGKSFIASNFASVIAATKQRVILIDADMRKGYLHELLGRELAPGLSDLITEKATLEDVIHTVQVGDAFMDIITRGQTPPNPSELLMHDYFERTLHHLSQNYDFVLIDSPPIHVATDPAIIGNHAGVVFMVVKSGQHTIKEIEHAVTRLSQNGVETKGFIFNGFDIKNTGYGHEYGYGYEYK